MFPGQFLKIINSTQIETRAMADDLELAVSKLVDTVPPKPPAKSIMCQSKLLSGGGGGGGGSRFTEDPPEHQSSPSPFQSITPVLSPEPLHQTLAHTQHAIAQHAAPIASMRHQLAATIAQHAAPMDSPSPALSSPEPSMTPPLSPFSVKSAPRPSNHTRAASSVRPSILTHTLG